MRRVSRVVAILSAAILLPALALAGSIGGNYYAPQYDYRDFFAATDGKPFQVILAGDAFPGVDPAIVAKDLLPAMQSAKPRPALTFTYDRPSPPPSPDYRLVLIFDPANDLNADPVCAGAPPRFRPGRPGVFYVYAIYCRNDRAMSYTTAWTPASGPADPRIERLFRELFMVIFSDQQRRFAAANSAFR
ncbi:MAG: hypothetical protein IKE60_07325 [Reyranella sp.]|jgi:hypothetical protein|uniref:hypothetical protein n=1 Tax=Reyranella sp. TaxID=1929291 RepID=UPI00095D7CEF|nr:hypothetical protein [Reyranella sp.]MBN9537563.1 hypothetical protein [Alphaproteobacteria bacterium]MBR2814446.1 hypothetical protein [Reyranella sp.]OJU31880.1 MAG: hypothetical protein BGN99_32400 [Alphaproteobacteria bacterium 65-37]